MQSVLNRFSRRLAVYRYDCRPDGARAKYEQGTDGHFQYVLADVLSIRSLFATDLKRMKRFLHFVDAGFSGLFLLQGEQCVSYGWYSSPGSATPHHLPRWVKHFDSFWIFHCHTREGFRGRGCFTKLLRHLIEMLRSKHSMPLIHADTRLENTISQHAILSAGFNPCGHITTYQLWVPRIGSLVIYGTWQLQEAHTSLSLAVHGGDGLIS